MPQAKKPAEILKIILDGEHCPPLILISSPDSVRRKRALSLVLKRFAEENEQGVKHYRVEKRGALLELGTDLHSLSLFEQQRFFILQEVEELDVARQKELSQLLKLQSQNTHLLVETPPLTASNPILLAARKHGFTIELSALKGFELKRWILKEAKQLGIGKVSEDALESLDILGDGDPDKISQIMFQISLFLNEAEELSSRTLAQLFTSTPTANEFELLDRILTQPGSAKTELHIGDLFSSGKNPFAMLGLLSRTVSQQYLIHHLNQAGLSPDQLKAKLSVSPWILKKLLNSSRSYDLSRLERAFRAILRADSMLKNKSLGPDAIFSSLMHRIDPKMRQLDIKNNDIKNRDVRNHGAKNR